MTIETEVAALTTATTALLQAVDVSKATLDQKVAASSTYATNAFNSAATAVAKATEAVTAASQALAGAAASEESVAQAAASAAAAAQIVYGNLITHPNKITESIAIPDGFNAFLVDPVQIAPNISITGLGNSTLRGL